MGRSASSTSTWCVAARTIGHTIRCIDRPTDARPPKASLTPNTTPFTHQPQLGAKGSGKTAFLQTLASALAQSPLPITTDIQPTTELDRVNVAKLVPVQEGRFARPLNFRVFDLWGTY